MKAVIGRTILGLLLFACAGIVLGMSSYFQSNYSRLNLLSSETVLNIVVASLTVLFELIYIPLRLVSSNKATSITCETIILGLLWVLWLASSAAYTSLMKDVTTVCNNREVLYRALRNSGYPSGLVSSTRNDLDKGCGMIQSTMAFSWIAWIITTFLLIWQIYYASSRSYGANAFRDGPVRRRSEETSRDLTAPRGSTVSDMTHVEPTSGREKRAASAV